MGKIICEVCGTVYPDSADSCPICGYSRDHGGFNQGEDLSENQQSADSAFDFDGTLEDFDLSEYASLAGMDLGESQQPRKTQQPSYQQPPRQAAPSQPRQGNKPIFDYDAVNPRDRRNTYDSYEDVGNEVTLNDYPQDYYDNYDNGDEGEGGSHVGLIIFLIVLILLLIAASGFLLVKFILPNLTQPPMTLPPETFVTEAPTTEATTDPAIPCESLTLLEGGEVTLSREGQFYLIHAVVSPEDTTDAITYQSGDENIILVDEGGKITAVGEGKTSVLLTCGSQVLKLPVTVAYSDETTAPQEGPAPTAVAPASDPLEATEEAEAADDVEPEEEMQETAKETEAAEATEAAETKEAGEAAEEETGPTLKNVELKLKKSDIKFGIKGVSFRMELDCDLTPEEVEWLSTDSNVVLVKNGVVTTVGNGTCKVVARYGDQEVSCVVRCIF